MTIHQAAKDYEIPYRTLLRLVKTGRIPAMHHPTDPGKWVLPPEAESLLLELSEYYAVRRQALRRGRGEQ